MKKLFILFSLLLSHSSFSQDYVHQVFVMNEGYFDFTTNQIVVPPTIGVYDPVDQSYVTVDTLVGARFASDMILDENYLYIAADNQLFKYDKNTMDLLNTQSVAGIRNLATWNDKIIVTRGDYDNTTFIPILFDSYLHVYNISDLSLHAEFDTITGPKWSTQNMIINDDMLYVAINNAFEWGNEKGIVGIVDMNTMNYTNEIDLGPDGKNPDNMVFNGVNIYTINNKDWSGASISEVDLSTFLSNTINISMVSTGCGTSCMKDNKIMYQISQDTELYEWDPQFMPAAGNPMGYSDNFYELSFDHVNNHLYASVTDYATYGKVNIYDDNHNLVSMFNTSITPGKIVFDIRNMSVDINEVSLEDNKKGDLYDIFGKRINFNERISNGIYILDGRKVAIIK